MEFFSEGDMWPKSLSNYLRLRPSKQASKPGSPSIWIHSNMHTYMLLHIGPALCSDYQQ